MTALDLTANAEEMREIAADVHRDCCNFVHPLLVAYIDRGEIQPGLAGEIRLIMQRVEKEAPKRGPIVFSQVFKLGKLLGHVAPLEDQLNTDRACPKSATGWHEWANNEQCCHCGKDVP